MTIPSKPRTRLFATASADDLPEQVLRGAKNGLPLPAVCLDVSLPPSPVSHCHSHGAVNCVTCQRIDTVPSPSCPVVMYSASCADDDCVYESCHKLAVKIKPVLKISAHLLLHLLYSHIWLLFSSLPSHSNRRHPSTTLSKMPFLLIVNRSAVYFVSVPCCALNLLHLALI